MSKYEAKNEQLIGSVVSYLAIFIAKFSKTNKINYGNSPTP